MSAAAPRHAQTAAPAESDELSVADVAREVGYPDEARTHDHPAHATSTDDPPTPGDERGPPPPPQTPDRPAPFKQPKAVWAVAFACVISFMGIGLVDPILPALSVQAARLTQPGGAAVHQLPRRHRGDDAGDRVGVQPHRREEDPDRPASC